MWLPKVFTVLIVSLATLACSEAENGPNSATDSVAAAVTTVPLLQSSDVERVARDPLAATSSLSLVKQSWTGDFGGMVERRVIRVLTVYGAGRYYLDNGEAKGIITELMQRFEEFVNKRLQRKHLRVHAVIIPVARDQLIPALLAGKGDLIAAGLSITPGRQQDVEFSIPTTKPLSEILVTGPAAPAVETLEDLSGQTLYLRQSSSYYESAIKLNEQLAAQGLAPVKIELMSELLEDDDLIEMVNSGLLPWIVVDHYKTQLWEGTFDELVVRNDIVLRADVRLGWAFRKDSPQFAEEINDFLKDNREGTLMGNILRNRYVRDFDWAANALSNQDYARFEKLESIFKKYGEQYGLDYLLVAAQGFQESRLDQSVRSGAGAIGVMQLLPSTAAGSQVGIPNIEEVDANIHAGVKYLRVLRDRYFDDPDIDPINKTLLSMAAYNAGPARMISLRTKARQAGYDPNVWFDNVEVIAAREIGRETVQYVANIYKYYLSYRMVSLQVLQHERAREGAGI